MVENSVGEHVVVERNREGAIEKFGERGSHDLGIIARRTRGVAAGSGRS